MHVDKLLAKLGNGTVLEETGGILVCCPAHGDGRPSLFVSLKEDGRALLYCRAGCKTADVLKAADLSDSDLFGVTGTATLSHEPPAAVDAGHVAALNVYVEAAAAEFAGSDSAVYAAQRFGVTPELAAELRLGHDDGAVDVGRAKDYRTKDYRAHPRLVVPFPDAHGTPRGLQGRDVGGACPRRWVNLSNPRDPKTRQVVARWDATGVFRPADAFPTVVVTEGPGDGLTAAAAGYVAVVIRGAGVARNERTVREILAAADADAEIVVFGDNDNGGTQFVEAVCSGLRDAGRPAKVGRIPAKVNDLADWRQLDPAGFAPAFHTAVSDAAAWSPTAPPVDEPDEPDEPGEPAKAYDPMAGTDIENARRALEIVGPDTAYVEGVGFLVWDGTVWAPMSSSRERAIGHRVADAMRAELADMPRGAEDSAEEKAYRAAVQRVRRMHMDSGLSAALNHLRTITGADVGEFDSPHHLLTFRNGTVDLRSGELLDHDRDHRLTKFVDLEYRPDAECPRWERFLVEVFPGDDEMPGFMRRLVGYGITGETVEHVFALLYGHGANGKSVFVNALSDVFRGITGHVSQAAVAYQRNFDPGAANPALAAFRGLRLAVLSELSDGLRLNEALLKQLTAGDPVTARELYRGQFTFTPTALMMMATNYKPDVRGQDEGFWRRTRLIPFVREFTGAAKDRGLPAKLRAEREGIAAWAVRGAVEWYASGLGEPESVTAAVAEYRQSSDVLDGFLPGVLVREDGAAVLLKDAFNAFQDWRDDEHADHVMRWGATVLRRQLENRKVTAVKRKRGMTLLGVRLAKPDERS